MPVVKKVFCPAGATTWYQSARVMIVVSGSRVSVVQSEEEELTVINIVEVRQGVVWIFASGVSAFLKGKFVDYHK